MKLLSLLLILCLALPVMGNVVCDCDYGGSFLQVARKARVVALVRVLKYKQPNTVNKSLSPLAMDVEVIKGYKGVKNKRVLTVWGDNGMECRPYILTFSPNKEYVVALSETSEGNDVNANYAISICGSYWLSVNEKTQTVTGNINSYIRMSSTSVLQKFEVALKESIH